MDNLFFLEMKNDMIGPKKIKCLVALGLIVQGPKCTFFLFFIVKLIFTFRVFLFFFCLGWGMLKNLQYIIFTFLINLNTFLTWKLGLIKTYFLFFRVFFLFFIFILIFLLCGSKVLYFLVQNFRTSEPYIKYTNLYLRRL